MRSKDGRLKDVMILLKTIDKLPPTVVSELKVKVERELECEISKSPLSKFNSGKLMPISDGFVSNTILPPIVLKLGRAMEVNKTLLIKRRLPPMRVSEVNDTYSMRLFESTSKFPVIAATRIDDTTPLLNEEASTNPIMMKC